VDPSNSARKDRKQPNADSADVPQIAPEAMKSPDHQSSLLFFGNGLGIPLLPEVVDSHSRRVASTPTSRPRSDLRSNQRDLRAAVAVAVALACPTTKPCRSETIDVLVGLFAGERCREHSQGILAQHLSHVLH
jgi:hypothetical protein